jgi:hypothetical protein
VWLQYASERANALGVEFATIAESHAIVSGAVGPEWVEDQERTGKNLAMLIIAKHPLYRHLHAPTDTSVLEICELALYLREFQRDPALAAIVKDLRSDKYDAVLLELAFAYRWRDAGAKVHLRPLTPSGEADFVAEIEELPFTVEVSAFPHDVFVSERFRLAGVVADTMVSVLQKQPPPVAVRLWIERARKGITKRPSAQQSATHAACGASAGHRRASALMLISVVSKWRTSRPPAICRPVMSLGNQISHTPVNGTSCSAPPRSNCQKGNRSIA